VSESYRFAEFEEMIEFNLDPNRLVNLLSPSDIKELMAGAHAHNCIPD
jgi:hypothetical protein